jgi:hypothetical protein
MQSQYFVIAIFHFFGHKKIMAINETKGFTKF